ncbi:MAG: ferrous iron transporter B [Oscillospiraceae bacterium]|nr:ferrous iron transporter B [Oscillospiraceae bacterium]
MDIKIALAGNPNSGKTTLFNALTGSNQFVGNWPGVTVEKKEGKLRGNKNVTITDLPGIYSLSPYTTEEVVSRNYLLNDCPDAILNIVDGTNLERNLYLTTQLAELGIPMVVAVNMMDAVNKNGDKINTEKLSERLGCAVCEISALKGIGIKEAAELAIKAARENTAVEPMKFNDEIEKTLTHIADSLGDVPKERKRWYAVKVFERDEKVLEELKLSKSATEQIETGIKSCEETADDDSESIITDGRYTLIGEITKKCCRKKNTGTTLSDKIDRIVTNRILALPIFAAIMVIMYYVSITSVGTIFTDWVNDGVFGDGWHLFGIGTSDYESAQDEYAAENIFTDEVMAIVRAAVDAEVIGAEDILGAIEDGSFGGFDEVYGTYGDELAEQGFDISELVDEPMEEIGDSIDPADYGVWVPGIPGLIESGLNAINCAPWLESLIVDGIVGGVGAVLGFVPQMLVLFIFLAFLEGCGYMARIAFVMDRIFRRFGLSGKSFIPMLIGSGCGVPGIMASRTIENERDRRMTIMTTTFIPCGAKMPIIALIAAALFGGAWWIAPSAYFIGVATIVVSGIMLKKTKMFAGDPAPFVMELPAYHLPTFGNVMRSMWERGYSFIKKAGTIILLSSIVIWAGSSFGWANGVFGFGTELELADTVLGKIGSAICWIFAPLGFGEPAAAVATVMGLVAKEEVVGVFGVLDFVAMTPLAGYSFLVFNLLCAPCFAAIGAIRREMNSAKWTWFAIGYQCGFAYAVSLMIYQFGGLFTGNVNIIRLICAAVVLGFMVYMLVRFEKQTTKRKQVQNC